MSDARRGFTLVEAMVALAILGVIIGGVMAAFSISRRQREGWERRVDDVYALVHGLERLRRELEVARGVVFPPIGTGSRSRREFLVVVDAQGRPVVYSVVNGALTAETLGPAGRPVPARVLMPRTDRVVFDHRLDTRAVRFQVFMGGMSLIATVRPANAVDATSFGFDDTYGI